jgi:potassium-dependent mechanosensitive channel
MGWRQRFKYGILWAYLLCFFLPVQAVSAGTALAESEADKEKLEKGPEYNTTELLQRTKNAVLSESTSLEELKNRLGRLYILQTAVFIEINAYNIQNSSHNNLLLQLATPVTDLEKALNENRMALNIMDDKIKDFTKKRDAVTELRRQAQDQIDLTAKQAAEIKTSGWPKPEKAPLLDVLHQLDRILDEKYITLQNLHDGYDSIIKRLETLKGSTSQLNGKLEQEIKRRSAQELLNRKYMLPKVFKKDAVTKEFAVLATNVLKPFQKEFWQGEGQRIRETAAMSLLILVFLTAVAASLVVRLRRYCAKYKKHPVVPTHRWRFLCVRLVRRSLILLGIILVLYSHKIIQFSYYRLPFHEPVFNIMLIFLFSRWLLDFLKFRQHDENLFIPQKLEPKIHRMTIWICYFAVAYIVIHWAVGEDSFILFAARLFIEIYLTACCVTFWRAIRNANRPFVQDRTPPKITSYIPLMMVTYLITLGALIIELSGYPAMALYWLVSWARTLAVLLWAVIFFNAIIEWRSDHQPSEVSDDKPLPAYPIRRLFVSIGWLLWFSGFIVALILAWSTKQNVFALITAILNKSFSIGRISLSPMGLLFFVLILFLTLVLTRLGRYIISEKIFVESDIEPGLQDSIATISIYVMWGLGLVMALSVLGVSTTSLAVVFGALSIGIGFGLQAIFNNFVSGIILLFERPIQIGDAVEVQGTMGTVKKINVRATVVQTFDNASLIIPNSEFISSQVTNWSFKEPSLRRKVSVGVAYGSDIELVRQTLLEIVNQTKNVLKKPKPDVIFDDHGDSALIFILRYWTTIDYYYTTSTDIRFAMDRLFGERNIEIAFPQMDVHIRSMPKDKKGIENIEKKITEITV